MEPLQALEYLKNEDKIAVASMDKNKYLGVDLLFNTPDLRINVVGGWNASKSGQAIEINGRTVPLCNSLEDLINNLSANEHPNIVVFPPQSVNVVRDIDNIAKLETKRIELIIIIRGFKSNLTLEEMKKIALSCRSAEINTITIELKNIGYSIGYLLEEAKNMPWTINKLDLDLREYLQNHGIKEGSFLDLGTGAGNQAVELSKLGFKVTATDLVKYAFEETAQNEDNVEFIEDDILNSKLEKKFDYILDRGCLHALGQSNYETYMIQIKRLLNDDGILFLKYATNDNKHLTSDVLSFYFSEEELYKLIQENFVVEEIRTTIYEQGHETTELKAIFAVLRKKTEDYLHSICL